MILQKGLYPVLMRATPEDVKYFEQFFNELNPLPPSETGRYVARIDGFKLFVEPVTKDIWEAWQKGISMLVKNEKEV